jgi:uncharacterized membrane protein YdjX (TVP38/TMEM64 family)
MSGSPQPAGTRSTVGRLVPFLPVVFAAWAVASYFQDGFVAIAVDAAMGRDNGIERLRELVQSAGALGPLVYILAVAVEVVLAPIPGALLYAPGGALFGGFWGGTFSLAGNVIGAGLATWIGAAFGARLVDVDQRAGLSALRDRLHRRGMILVLLCRLNPLTSSDLVSYAAGMAGLGPGRVMTGTAIGMLPLCYIQAYAADWIFSLLPGSGLVVLVLAAAYLAVVCVVLFRSRL